MLVGVFRAADRLRDTIVADSVWLCRYLLGNRLRIGPALADGRVEVQLRGHSARSLAGEIAGIGAAIEILDPPEVRDELATLGSALVALYAGARA